MILETIKNQHRLLIAGLAQDDVGLSNVLNAIVEELKNSWSIMVFAYGLEDKSYKSVEHVKTELSILPNWEKSTQIHFKTVINDFKPDVILIIGSPWKTSDFTAVAAKYKLAKLAVYMPVEGRPVDKRIVDSLAGVDLCITYTEFAKSALNDLRIDNNLKLISIGHGHDTYYKPITTSNLPAELGFRQTLREKLFPNHPEYWKRPMLLNSNRSYYRKRLDLTIKGFALALKEIDASLYLNIARLKRYERSKLEALIKSLGIENNVMLNTLNGHVQSIPKEQLLKLYNTCDIGITTAMGEGWGLCVFEHAATGAAQIVPDHSSFSENWPNQTALKFKAETPVYVEAEAAEMYEGKPEAISSTIKQITANTSLIDLYGQNAFEHVNNEKYKWSTIGANFDSALKFLVNDVVLN
ncbi:glycosyltransferase [Winogradskyella sp.]|uniref:glycosyltransferase n=1 Tax=Winogradskyella sp. TaxID=1883156 RepID=UPI0025DF70D0|nr:glycosyltransferase [Winogradskyella sp.]